MLSIIGTSSAAVASTEGNGRPAFEEFLRHLSGQEKELDVISVDHSYARSWSSHPDSHHSKPARLLFMKLRRQQTEVNVTEDVMVDVDSETPVVPPYDNPKTRAMMNECDQFLQNTLNQDPDETEQLNKNSWSSCQKSLHKQMMKILQGSHLSKLASVGTSTEVVKRKIMIEKAARRVRKLFASYSWEMTLLCWLHQTLMDSLSAPILSEYFEILRALKAKVPNLIDKLLAKVTTFHSNIFGSCSTEAFSQLLRKPWDPVLSQMTQNKPKKVSGNPLIVIVPSAPNQTVANQNQRMKFVMNQLGSLGKVIYSAVHSSNNMAVGECLDQIFTSTRSKVAELKNQHPARPIVLAGWTVGALLACHVALEESVAAVICFGFPLKGVNGSRGDLDDPLLDSKVPTLFLIGQNSNSCSMDDMEDFRERMRAETGLVVVGGADDMLRVSVSKKKSEGVTQSMVDRCLVDEVGDFLNGVLGQHSPSQSVASRKPYVSSTLNVPPQQQQQQQQPQQQFQSHVEEAKRQRRRPREYSPEFSPVKRKPKPQSYQSVRKISASSSSDTSSTGSYALERTSKREKKKTAKKVGRPPLSLGKKRKVQKIVSRGGLKVKIPVMPPKKEVLKPLEVIQDKKIVPVPKRAQSELESLLTAPIPEQESPPPPPPPPPLPPVVSNKPVDTPKSLSLVNQQKNGPVDVEKAFGRDSSFLPRPLTPAEMDQGEVPPSEPSVSLSATSTLKVLPPSEATVSEEDAATKSLEVSFAATLSPDKKKVSFLTTSAENFPLATFTTGISSAIAVQSPQIIAKIAEPRLESGKFPSAIQALQSSAEAEPSLSISKIVTSQQPTLLSGSALTIKHFQNTVSSLAGKSLISTSAGAFSKPQTILVTPSTSINKQTTFLMTSPDGSSTVNPKKIQVRRMVVKTPASPSSRMSVPLLSKLSAVAGTSGAGESLLQPRGEQTFDSKVCNLSLLSDVAGMKEPIRHHVAQELLNSASSSATLVKLTSASDLANSDKRSISSPIRRFRLIEAIPSSAFSQASSQHVETPEEYAEKQMAIQALNSTLNEGADESATTSTSSEGTFNVGYHKPSATNRPYSMLGYSVVMPRPRDATVLGTRIPFRRGRGMNPFGSTRRPRIQRFYPF